MRKSISRDFKNRVKVIYYYFVINFLTFTRTRFNKRDSDLITQESYYCTYMLYKNLM